MSSCVDKDELIVLSGAAVIRRTPGRNIHLDTMRLLDGKLDATVGRGGIRASPVLMDSDRIYRLVYRYGFRVARLLWRLTQPRHTGALVMFWHGGDVLLVRTSYQDVWTAPAGALRPLRPHLTQRFGEVVEEVGLRLDPDDLRPALVAERFWYNRHGGSFLRGADANAVDARARQSRTGGGPVRDRAEAQAFPLAPHLQDYFRTIGTRGATEPSTVESPPDQDTA